MLSSITATPFGFAISTGFWLGVRPQDSPSATLNAPKSAQTTTAATDVDDDRIISYNILHVASLVSSMKLSNATLLVLFCLVAVARPSAPTVEKERKRLQQSYFVSVCGMELKSVFDLPQFFVYAVPALIQAWFAPGNVRARYLPFADFSLTSHRTLSAWETEEDLMEFVRGGAHSRAVEAIPGFARVASALRIETDDIPTFAEILPTWEEEGVIVFGGDGGTGRHF